MSSFSIGISCGKPFGAGRMPLTASVCSTTTFMGAVSLTSSGKVGFSSGTYLGNKKYPRARTKTITMTAKIVFLFGVCSDIGVCVGVGSMVLIIIIHSSLV